MVSCPPQVDYFNKRRVLALRQDLMERRAAEQVKDMANSESGARR